MSRIRLPLLPLALLLTASTAGAQRSGGSPTSAGQQVSHVETRPATGGSWNGTASKWGGSPVQVPRSPRVRPSYMIPVNAYNPAAVAAPAPVAVSYVVDTVFVVPPASPVDMKVVKSGRSEPELTAMDVYRQQRFKKP